MAMTLRDSAVRVRTRPSGLIETLGFRKKEPPPAPPARPTDADMVSALVIRHGASELQAQHLIEMLKRARTYVELRERPYTLNYLDTPLHPLLNQVIPAGSPAGPGSTHALLNKGLLEEGRSFRHGMSADQCSIEIDCE